MTKEGPLFPSSWPAHQTWTWTRELTRALKGVCAWYMSDQGSHSPGGETMLTHTGIDLPICSYPTRLMWANMKMWIWASSCMRGTDGTKCEEALTNSSRGSESRKQWCTECLLVEVLALCRIPKSPSWGLGSQKGGVKHGKTVGVEYLLVVPHLFSRAASQTVPNYIRKWIFYVFQPVIGTKKRWQRFPRKL